MKRAFLISVNGISNGAQNKPLQISMNVSACGFIDKITPEIVSGFFATILAVVVAAIYVAHIKVERLRLEFSELSEILEHIHNGRSENEDYRTAEIRLEALKLQIGEIIRELAAAREGVFSAPISFKKKLRDLEKEINSVVVRHESADFVRKLFGDSVVECEFRQKILSLVNQSKVLGEELSCYSFLIPG